LGLSVAKPQYNNFYDSLLIAELRKEYLIPLLLLTENRLLCPSHWMQS